MDHLPDFIFYFFVSVIILNGLILSIKFFFIISYRYGNKNRNPEAVTIIICARNECENLMQLLPDLFSQDYPNFKIIVVLDRCNDDSFSMLKRFGRNHPELKILVINEVPYGFNPKKYGLTRAIQEVESEWVLLTDADCRPASKYWISEFSAYMIPENDFIIGCSPYDGKGSALNQFINYETFNTALEYISATLMGRPYMSVGRNFAYRRSIFMENKGFSDFKGILGGDDDLFLQFSPTNKKTAVSLSKASLVWTLPKPTWPAYLKQKTRHMSVGKYYKKSIIVKHLLQIVSRLVLWGSFSILAILDNNLSIVGIMMIGYLLLKGVLYHRISLKLGFGFNFLMTPVLDIAHPMFVSSLGLFSYFRKNIKWK